jgi:nucleotide-binding universal stress UspA family protein
MGRIVVGVDGSEGSRRALLWAAREASFRGAALEVIHTYEPEPAKVSYAYDETMGAEVWETVHEAIEAAARRAAVSAQALVDDMIGELDEVEVEGSAIEGRHAAQTLIERSRDADMLVLGSRGRGGFKRLLLGSVSQQCAHHAECPVVIVRSAAEHEA